MIWELLSDNQKERVIKYVKSSGLEIGEVYCQVKENTKEPMVFDSEMRLINIDNIIQEIYLRDLNR
jgi:hypothetical protein